MSPKQRQREIAKWLLIGAKDIEDGAVSCKTAQEAAYPYLLGAFSGDRKLPSPAEIDEVADLMRGLL